MDYSIHGASVVMSVEDFSDILETMVKVLNNSSDQDIPLDKRTEAKDRLINILESELSRLENVKQVFKVKEHTLDGLLNKYADIVILRDTLGSTDTIMEKLFATKDEIRKLCKR